MLDINGVTITKTNSTGILKANIDSGNEEYMFIDNSNNVGSYINSGGMHSIDFIIDGQDISLKGVNTKADNLNTYYNTLNGEVVKTITASGTAPLTLGATKSGNNVSITGSIASATASNKGIVKVDDSTYLLNPNNAPKADSGTAASPYAVAMALAAADGMVNGVRNEASVTGGIGIIGGGNPHITPGVTLDLDVAKSTELGGIKIGYTENGKNYAVKLDTN
jgi:hypothetical protein